MSIDYDTFNCGKATSEVPFLLLPQEIRQFFRNDLSICRPTTSEHTVPRFSVQIDGGFNHDMVINQSAAELSRDIAKLLVHLIHQKSHTKTSACTKYQISVIQGESNAANQQTDKETANGQAGEKKSPDVNPVRVAPLPGCRTIRVKSNLVSVISTFGYQILQYPHFAELCWVTSKLKEGPSEDVSGPWKGWPFNSCIIRPMSALEKVASSSLSNGKSKEISGIVRGLVAVGLSAIRGAYTSLRKVSFDVRLVLDLLVEQINAKISAGKDRYQYVRLLSQVAYLEDVVNNWAFTLQSLEQDSQKMEASKNHTSGGNEFQCNEVQCEESIRVVSEKSSPTHEILEVSRQGPVDEKVVCNGSLGDGDVDHSHSKDGTFISEGCGEKNFCFCNSVFNESHHDAAAAADDHLAYNIPSNHNDEATVVGPDDLGNGRNCTSVETPLNLRTESVVDLEHHHKNSSELCADEFLSCTKPSSIGNGHSSLENGCKHVDSEPDTSNREVNIHLSPCRSGPSTNSALVCSIRCCTGCLNIIYDATKNILHSKFGLNQNNWTVEDVHDFVVALSVDLLAAVRREFVDGSNNRAFNDRRTGGKEDRFESLDSRTCCKSSKDMALMPVECICHSENETSSERVNPSPYSEFGLDPNFIFRDGVLVNLDPEKNVSFHCKLETLCLCSLTELIVMANKPFR